MIKVAYEIYKVLSKLGIKPKDVIGMGGDIVKMGKSLFNTQPNPKLLTFIKQNQKIPAKTGFFGFQSCFLAFLREV